MGVDMHMTGLAIAGFGLTLLMAGAPASPVESASRAKPRPATYDVPEVGHPKNKGNSRKRGNYWNKGRSINSGNFSNVIDSYDSNNTYGGSANNVNGPQHLVVRPKRR
jgi:hypothetical protein